jgi:hypothetical protein
MFYISPVYRKIYRTVKHIKSYNLYGSNSTKKLVSPSLSPITTYFETSQGSKYLLSEKGETKRWKSAHANTGGEDSGLKEWYPYSMFVPQDDQDSVMAYEHLLDKGYKVSLSKTQNDKQIWVIYKEGKWSPATYGDAFPTYSRLNPDKATKPLAFSSYTAPAIGLMAVEYKQEPNGVIRSFHPGSPVSKVMPVDQANAADLAHFNIKA